MYQLPNVAKIYFF